MKKKIWRKKNFDEKKNWKKKFSKKKFRKKNMKKNLKKKTDISFECFSYFKYKVMIVGIFIYYCTEFI